MNVGWLALVVVQAIAQNGRVQAGVQVTPDTVTVGDPFEVVVRVRAPRGATIEFPQTPDSGAAVEALDPVQVTPSADTTVTENSAMYRVAAWDVGQLRIPFADALVREGNATRRVALAGVTVFVRSVLPADSTLRVPKPPRDLFTFGPPWWMWVLAVLVAGALLWLGYWLWKRRRRRAPVAVDPWDEAERDFARVEALGLVAAGERSRHAVLMVEVLRDYLAAVMEDATPSLTTSELLGRLRGSLLPAQRLAALLAEVDLVKFARRPLGADRALELGREARALAGAAHNAVAGPPLQRAA